MSFRGVVARNVVVVLGILTILGALLLTLCVGTVSVTGGDRDYQSLSKLVYAVEAGVADGKALPRSTGHRFWIALFIGDGGEDPDSPKGRRSIEETAFLRPENASLLLAEADANHSLSYEELRDRLQRAIDAGHGVADLGDEIDTTWCSWAGPADPAVAFAPGEDRYIAASGTRDGKSFFAEGFIAALPNGAVEFLMWKALAADERYDYTFRDDETDTLAVKYGQAPLELVAPFEQ